MSKKVRKRKTRCFQIVGALFKESEILDQMSPDFDEFLNFLGDRVKLEGFTKYAGGLDVKSEVFYFLLSTS